MRKEKQNMCKTFPSGIVVLLGAAAVALGQVSEGQNKLLAKRAAEADAYRKLAETVYGLTLSSSTFVKDFVTENDEIRTGVDAVVRGARFGQPRWNEDGTCEISAEVTVEKLITTIKELHTAYYKGNTITTTDIENIKQQIHSDVISVVGMGAPRPDLPPDLPTGVEAQLTEVSIQAPPTTFIPEIWKSVSGQARLMAARAARVDAQRKLLEQIKGLRLNSETLVRDFVTESDTISAQAQGIVIGAREVGTYYHDDALIVDVTMEVPVEKVIATLKELHTQHYQGNLVTTTDITNLTKTLHRTVVQAVGSGTPRIDASAQATIKVELQMPTWSTQPIVVIGQGSDPEISTPQGRLKAIRAAQADGQRKLLEQIQGLQIDSNTTVRDFVTESDIIRTQVMGVLAGAVTGTPRISNDVAEIEVSINPTGIWEVVVDARRIHTRG